MQLFKKRKKRKLQMVSTLMLVSLPSLAMGYQSSASTMTTPVEPMGPLGTDGMCLNTLPMRGMTILKDEAPPVRNLAANENQSYRGMYDHLDQEQTPRILMPNNHVEFEGHTIGDSHRSSQSFQSFFKSVDLDGDGKIRRPELDRYLKETIGGSAFDEVEERENEVGIIMDKMDLEGDGRLEMGDVNSYWEKLESLLTVDEVAEWIVHAGQLPKDIGRYVSNLNNFSSGVHFLII